MGSSAVVFDKKAGVNFTRNKKRMRGEIIRGPEVKKWNCFSGTDTYTSYDFCNLLHAPNPYISAFSPFQMVWPSMGTGSANRIGKRITFLGFRLKGWITLSATQLKQIRWRIVLARLDMPAGTLSFDASGYLSQFNNASSNVPGTTFNQESYETFARHNFYKKFKDVDNKNFKTKVLVSGTLPATNEYKKLNIDMSGTISGQNCVFGTSSVSPSYVMGLHSGNMGYIPIDVKVKLNDTVDCAQNMRRYFMVFEADCGYGWTEVGGPSGNYVGVIANVYCRGYFTDE